MAKDKDLTTKAEAPKIFPITEKIKGIGYWHKIDGTCFSIKKFVIGAKFNPANGSQGMGIVEPALCFQSVQFNEKKEAIFEKPNDGEFFVNLTDKQAYILQRAGVIK